MATREELYERFSPNLIEAMAHVMKNEINILRENPTTVYAARTDQQMIDAIAAELDSQPDFPWQA